ncbi:MAG TPA: hypothetical protein VGC30_00090 [Dokdonella sp.]
MRTVLVVATAAAAALAGHAAAGTFIDVGPGQLTSLSRNGRIAASSAWRWNKDRGTTPLTGFVSGNGMNSWAQPVAGAWTDADGNTVAALAYSNSDLVGEPVVIGAWPGGVGLDGSLSVAYDVSDTGVAVGLAYDETGTAIAFRWTAAGGMTRLAVNRPANASRANAISADGSTIVGWNDRDDGSRTGVIWRDGVPLDLVDAAGAPVGEALAVSADGRVASGTGYVDAQSGDVEAWRWTAETGVQPIGCLGELGCGPAYGGAVADDGSVVVGWNGADFDRSAAIWTATGGMQPLADYLAQNGVAVPDGWTLGAATAVSADGETIGGWGLGPTGLESFVADLHDPVAEASVEAHGVVDSNTLTSGPFAGVPAGTPVTLRFRIAAEDSVELEPGEDTRYPIELDTFELSAGTASDTLVATDFGPGLDLANDYPLSDGIHLFSSPLSTPGQSLEFELFNPGGDLFDSDDLDRINRTFDASFFEKIAWSVSQGDAAMSVDLDTVRIEDYAGTPPTYTIGGDVRGLAGSGLVLQQNGGDDLAIGADGAFVFATPLSDGSAYAVSVLEQPTDPAQTCTVANGSGSVDGADVTNVEIDCTTEVTDRVFADGFDG